MPPFSGYLVGKKPIDNLVKIKINSNFALHLSIS